MTMMAVETTVLFTCSRYRNRPEICQSQKRALFRNIPANTAFNMRSYFRRLFSPLNFDWRTIACVGQLQRSIPSSGALIFFSRTIARRLQDPTQTELQWRRLGTAAAPIATLSFRLGSRPVPSKGTASNVACRYFTLNGSGIKGKAAALSDFSLVHQ
ncbi:hypothetical protein CN195_26425 [Sinorhizobium meliloti]|nr:hypothetical protein CN195_26425 [Sinorhizobium meliloti]